MERVKGEGFIEWVHRRLDEGDSHSAPSEPSNPLTPSDPSVSPTGSPNVEASSSL